MEDSNPSIRVEEESVVVRSSGSKCYSHHRRLDDDSSSTHSTTDAAVTIDVLTLALLISAILYMFCLILAKRKYSVLHRVSPLRLTTKKLLILSVALVSVVRIMTILGVAMMNIANVRAHYSLQPPQISSPSSSSLMTTPSSSSYDQHQNFYDKSMTVLFDLPNCMVVSTYVLLTLVWAECFVDARMHTESAMQLKKNWLIYFMIFNSALYILQLTLYGSLFLAPHPSRVVRSIIYVGITGINFTAVVLVLIFYVYLSFHMSGFPYRSQRLKASLSRVSSVMTLWTCTRIVWGIATLLVFVYNIELLQDSNTPVWSFVVLLLMFLVCEILPIIALLDYSYLNMIGLERIYDLRWTDNNNYNNNEGNINDDSSQTTVQTNNTLDPLFSTTNPTSTTATMMAQSRTASGRSVRWQDEMIDPLLSPPERESSNHL